MVAMFNVYGTEYLFDVFPKIKKNQSISKLTKQRSHILHVMLSTFLKV